MDETSFQVERKGYQRFNFEKSLAVHNDFVIKNVIIKNEFIFQVAGI